MSYSLLYLLPLTALSVSVVGLERALLSYCSQPNDNPFDIKTVPIETLSLSETTKCKDFIYLVYLYLNIVHLFIY